LAYLPRALVVGLFSPFPDTWAERPTLPRVIGAIETLIFYLMAPGILILAWRRPSNGLFASLIISAAMLTVLSFTSPNVGTLHRIRYGPLFIFMLAGAGGWAWLLGKGIGMLGSFTKLGTAAHQSNPQVVVANDGTPSGVCTNPSGVRALGAGAMVTLISVVGYLGLLIRDLLLINRSGFGASLDSFLSGHDGADAFCQHLGASPGRCVDDGHSSDERPRTHSILAWSHFGMDTDTVWTAWLDAVFRRRANISHLVVSGEIEEAVMLLPIALLLFLFSGVVVTGNSLVNSLGRPALAAAAQLVVPLAAVAAILFAPDDQIIKSATIAWWPASS
jgi:putative peptidoglycan lipid II flippase